MSWLARALPFVAALTMVLPSLLAAQTLSQPHRRGADPALVRTLQSHHWTLQAATDAAGKPMDALQLPGHAFVLDFEGDHLSIHGGCNRMNGSWRISPQGQLMVGRLAATMMACEPALMRADTALTELLAQHLEVQLEPGATPSLRLVSPTRQTLALNGQPTLDSLYGKPTTLFLEVAAQTVPCQPGAGAPTQCLQVRDRKFDKQGLRIEPPGQWRAFYGQIDGYTHTPGVRNVLRVKRYERKQVPADASRYVYVLDLVVESETVAK